MKSPTQASSHDIVALFAAALRCVGPMPKELGALSELKELGLNLNQLTGPIPPEVGNLVALAYLSLAVNQLSGHIPKELGSLSKLETLRLNLNELTGPIPPELGNLRELNTLSLLHNQLTGHIPKELGALRKLETLWLNHNELTGPIPPELGNLAALETLSVWKNNLTALWDHTQDVHGDGHEGGTHSKSGGRIPSQLCRLLDVFDCATCYFDNNPWAEPPEPIVGKGSKDIRGYFEDLYADPYRIQRDSIKIILVGQEGAGKTSLRQSMKANQAAPTREWKEESTVFADVESMVLKGTSVRVYDCAGQVAYTGLLQMFLTPRSVCVLVCNAEAFGNPGDGIGGQVENDCRKLEELCVSDWLRCISRRVPDNEVILVATKCDLVGGIAMEIGQRMEKACRTLLARWVHDGMEPVKVEDVVCLTSCCSTTMNDGGCLKSCWSTSMNEQGESGSGPQASEGRWACDWRDNMDENPSPGLLDRLVNKRDGGLRGTHMVLPRSWDIALTFLEALERGRDPVEMTVPKLADCREEGAQTAGPTLCLYQGITVEELRAKWQETVLELEQKGLAISNAEHALEGALSIREIDGSLVRHDTFVFLDVVWLAKILKPLLNHKDEEVFDGSVKLGDAGDARTTLDAPSDIVSWHRLKREGILEPRLAQVIWPAGLSEYVLPTLASLDLTFPLENDPAEGLVVLLRLKPGRPKHVRYVVDTFRPGLTPTLTASWKIFFGVPPGAIEKVLTRCCNLGGVRTFWRSGVLVHGRLGDPDERGTFAVVVQYSSYEKELTAQVYGDRSSPAPWTALSYVSSAVRSMLLEFPGLRSRGSLECPQHGGAMPLADTATRAGDNLLGSAGCPQCSPEIGGLGAAAVELVRMVDIRLDRGVIFQDVKARFGNMESRYTFSRPPPNSQGEEALLERIAATVDRIEGGIQESLICLKRLQAPNYPYPHLVAVKEIATQGKRSPLSKLRGLAMKDMTLHFLCPVDMEKVPCGMNGEGYRFRERRSWVKKLAPVLQVAVVTAKVALKAAGGLDVDVSEFLQAVKDGLVEEIVDGALDEEALFRVVNGDENASADMQRDASASYEVLKEFMEKKLDRGKNTEGLDGYIDFREKMQRVSDGRGGMVWVRIENVREWRNSLSSAAPSR
ncbi:unnamed protein product [Ectocarpus sp. 4 AP-2014]